MKNRRFMIAILLLAGLLAFADVSLGFTSVNLYAAETSSEQEQTEEKMTQVSQNEREEIDWNLVFLIVLSAVSGATAAIYGVMKKR